MPTLPISSHLIAGGSPPAVKYPPAYERVENPISAQPQAYLINRIPTTADVALDSRVARRDSSRRPVVAQFQIEPLPGRLRISFRFAILVKPSTKRTTQKRRSEKKIEIRLAERS